MEVEHAQGPLRRFLRVLCGGDSFTADDIAQEALLKAWLHFGDFTGKSRFATWLYRIAYNCWYDHCRKHSRDGEPDIVPDIAPAQSVKYEDPEFDRYAELYKAIDSLSAPEKLVILLFYMEGRSVKEMEIITGIASGTIRSHLSRGRKHLRESLGKI